MEEPVVFTPKLVPKTDPVEAVVTAPKPPKLGVFEEPKTLPTVLPVWLVPKLNGAAVVDGVPNVNPPPVEAWLEAPRKDIVLSYGTNGRGRRKTTRRSIHVICARKRPAT